VKELDSAKRCCTDTLEKFKDWKFELSQLSLDPAQKAKVKEHLNFFICTLKSIFKPRLLELNAEREVSKISEDTSSIKLDSLTYFFPRGKDDEEIFVAQKK
jgi:hypothetical protein